MDVSDPRAVGEKVSTIPGIKLMFRDQIIEMVEENETIRMGKVPEVEKMIAKEVPIIEATMKRLDTEPIVSDAPVTVDDIRKKELEKALEILGETDEKKIKIIEELTKTVAEGIISAPSKKAAEKSD